MTLSSLAALLQSPALGESELKLDRLKGRSVFPGHFDNAIKILAGKRFHRRSTQECER